LILIVVIFNLNNYNLITLNIIVLFDTVVNNFSNFLKNNINDSPTEAEACAGE
tara:strand:- start:434 stop:592 length:159 start_codon:yes stop_codon:yes gene_type:complete